MSFPTDVEIARSANPRPIMEIAHSLGLPAEDLIPYGYDKAKVHFRAIEKSKNSEGQLILVSAITPTPAGEGKTTTAIGLAEGMKKLNKRVALALREPSMGPVFGMKGGATGGGYSQVIPMEDINLQFTGDFPAVSAAHNLLAAALDNAVHYRQIVRLDPRCITFPRVMDINDRALRRVIIGLGGKKMGVPRETFYHITAASEVMAILCLAKNYEDLKARLKKILVGLTYNGEPITADSLKVVGAMMALLRNAIHPNLVQTLDGVPAFIHGGPFANIAHGANSIIATRMALAYADYAITEAGFGFDLGAEKFFDITCAAGNFAPEACVLVTTVRALKMHGGIGMKRLKKPDTEAVSRGLSNMEKHIESIHSFQVPVVVAINKFHADTNSEIQVIVDRCRELAVPVAVTDHFSKGGEGATALAETVLNTLNGEQLPLKPLYDYEWKMEDKIEKIAEEMYGAEHVDYTVEGKRHLETIERLGYGNLGVCMAKTQKSLSDNPDLLGRPEHFIVTVKRIEISAGAGFVVPITGEIIRMPGLPRKPIYTGMDIDSEGSIIGIF